MRKRGMPLIVCKVGSGALAASLMGAAAGACGGIVWVLARADEADRAAIRAQIEAGTYAPSPPMPIWPLYLLLAATLLAIWWHLRKPLYAHCVRYWHPELAPPRKIPCPTCETYTCPTCGDDGEIDEPVAAAAPV